MTNRELTESRIASAQQWVCANCVDPDIENTILVALDVVHSAEDRAATARLAEQPQGAQAGDLPELPACADAMALAAWGPKPDYFTADQMHAYARAAIAALRQPSARDEHIRWLGLNMLVCAARQRGGEDEQACAELDALWKTGEEHDETDWVDAARWLSDCVKQWPKDDAATPPRPIPSDDVRQRARELLAAECERIGPDVMNIPGMLSVAAEVREGKHRADMITAALRAIESALNQAPPSDETLADTQRAIIEAAERRGYERGVKEAQQQPGAQGAVAVVGDDLYPAWVDDAPDLPPGTKLYLAAPALPEVSEALGSAVERVLNIVDDMACLRQELCEDSIKELDRRLMNLRERISAAATLEEKLTLMKDQRQMERMRADRKIRLFKLIDDGAIYASDDLPRDELLALVAPLRAALESYRASLRGEVTS
jgi:hypothetical protein